MLWPVIHMERVRTCDVHIFVYALYVTINLNFNPYTNNTWCIFNIICTHNTTHIWIVRNCVRKRIYPHTHTTTARQESNMRQRVCLPELSQKSFECHHRICVFKKARITKHAHSSLFVCARARCLILTWRNSTQCDWRHFYI